MIQRPDLVYNDKTHSYFLNGEKLLGVSTVSKIGDVDVWSVASAWAFRIGYEGAYDLVLGDGSDSEQSLDKLDITKDDLREMLKRARKTPWHKSDDSKDRGNAIHQALESLAQHGIVPILEDYPEAYRGYIRGLCKWYLDKRPTFDAVEVQVVSEKHLFAGRYDMRCIIDGELLLVDLKTGKRVYESTQFPQLAGYELAGVEMGYAPTDAQFILNVHEDGSYDFKRSNATAEHFLAFLAAQRAIQDLKQKNKRKK